MKALWNYSQKYLLILNINYENISWTKKELNDLFNIGDVIYVKKVKDKVLKIKLEEMGKNSLMII